ncbi:MAG: PAS domain S-box protein [Rhodoplanes sp.]
MFNDEQFRPLLDAIPNGMMAIDEAGIITFVNSRIETMFGYSREELIGRGVEFLVPERFRAAHPALRDHFAKSLQTGPMGCGRGLSGLRKDTTEFPVEIGLNLFRTCDRVLVVASVIDITERERDEDRVRFIMDELSHRSKNLLMIVLGIANQTVRTGDLQKLESRLMALARSHDLLEENRWAGARVEALIYAQLGLFADVIDRVDAAGPLIMLRPEAAQSIGLALHELVTNAMNFGALSSPEGRVAIRWDIDDQQTRKKFWISWQERGGPPVSPPGHKGFGCRLLSRIGTEAAAVEGALVFAPEGFSWRFETDEQSVTALV